MCVAYKVRGVASEQKLKLEVPSLGEPRLHTLRSERYGPPQQDDHRLARSWAMSLILKKTIGVGPFTKEIDFCTPPKHANY